MTSSHNVVVCDNGTGVRLAMSFFPYHSAVLKGALLIGSDQLHCACDGAESILWQGFVYQIQTAVCLGYVGAV